MSRVAKKPVSIPAGVDVKISGNDLSVKGKAGQLSYKIHTDVNIEINDNVIQVQWDSAVKKANSQAGTARASIFNMITGVTKGFDKKLTLIGVGYRAQVKGSLLTLSLGFSNPIEYRIPDGITVEAISQTELVVKGSDKQQVGQVASEIRAFRPPEPYKGKGVRYTDEYVARKAAKKK
ncbi:MAG: 50S ribosomal protein L6 [Methylococcales symbiont of Hymedesmia sp. n. MRB-2018]|nr:MAG: 50S ribosomal protein L6 [Methylococcales symbiont of Hymedesmia sp. n. MRB-2018]KAF3982768.1 MAG: 50S ribosomal protein L6 [Methylococcales symbiont of Hymedesmia sp. n. MRB-2018]